MNCECPAELLCSCVKSLTLSGSWGFCDNAPALNTAARFMSVHKSLQRTEGLLQDLFWITAAFRRSTPFNTSNFTTAAFENNRANKATFPNIVTEHKVNFFP